MFVSSFITGSGAHLVGFFGGQNMKSPLTWSLYTTRLNTLTARHWQLMVGRWGWPWMAYFQALGASISWGLERENNTNPQVPTQPPPTHLRSLKGVFSTTSFLGATRCARFANAAKNRDLQTANFASGIRPHPCVTLWTYLIGHDSW